MPFTEDVPVQPIPEPAPIVPVPADKVPRWARKVLYIVLVVAGVLGLAGGIAFPDIATEAATRADQLGGALTSLVSLLGTISGAVALLHLTPKSGGDHSA